MDWILSLVASVFGVSRGDVKSRLQVDKVASARHAFAWQAKRKGYDTNQIAKFVNRAKPTINQSIRAAQARIDTDADYAQKVKQL